MQRRKRREGLGENQLRAELQFQRRSLKDHRNVGEGQMIEQLMRRQTKEEVFLKSWKHRKILDDQAADAAVEGRRKIYEKFSKYRKHRKTLEDWTADKSKNFRGLDRQHIEENQRIGPSIRRKPEEDRPETSEKFSCFNRR